MLEAVRFREQNTVGKFNSCRWRRGIGVSAILVKRDFCLTVCLDDNRAICCLEKPPLLDVNQHFYRKRMNKQLARMKGKRKYYKQPDCSFMSYSFYFAPTKRFQGIEVYDRWIRNSDRAERRKRGSVCRRMNKIINLLYGTILIHIN